MKQILALMLALCLAVGLTACGASSVPVGDSGREALRGSFAQGVYSCEPLDLRISLPKFWTFCSDDQIAELNELDAGALADTDVAGLIAEKGRFMSMMMTEPGGGTINLIIQPNQPALEEQSDEQLLALAEQSMKKQFSEYSFQLNRSGVIYDCYTLVKTSELLRVQTGGGERPAIHMLLDTVGLEQRTRTEYTLYSVDQYQLWYHAGEYMGVLTIVVKDAAELQPILDGITD